MPSSTPENPLKGMAIMATCMAILPLMDAIAKYMATTEAMSPAQVTFYRFFFQLVCILPLAVFTGAAIFRPKRPWMNLLRGVLHAAASLMFFAAVKYMPLADVFAIYFVEPFMLTMMSAIFLREKVGWRRWLAIVVGFSGAMIVIQPSYAIFGWTALLPVACAFLFTLYLFLNRAIGKPIRRSSCRPWPASEERCSWPRPWSSEIAQGLRILLHRFQPPGSVSSS